MRCSTWSRRPARRVLTSCTDLSAATPGQCPRPGESWRRAPKHSAARAAKSLMLFNPRVGVWIAAVSLQLKDPVGNYRIVRHEFDEVVRSGVRRERHTSQE